MKSILMSIQPKWCEKIASGEKTIEVRKTAPKPPFKAIIWEPKNGGGCGKVIGEFICDEVEAFAVGSLRCDDIEKLSCLSYTEMITYFYKPEELDGNTAKWGKALHITAPKLYDKPKELSGFRKLCIMSEMPYCPACKFGNIKYSSDEVECSRDIEGASCEWLCANFVKRPPQSWQYVGEIEE